MINRTLLFVFRFNQSSAAEFHREKSNGNPVYTKFKLSVCLGSVYQEYPNFPTSLQNNMKNYAAGSFSDDDTYNRIHINDPAWGASDK